MIGLARDAASAQDLDVMAGEARDAVVFGAGPTFGTNGVIPRQYLANVHLGIRIAWHLTANRSFLEVFRTTIAKMTQRDGLPIELYASALNSMTLNLAETSRNPLVVKEVRGLTHLEGSAATAAPAMTSVKLGQTWLREFLLREDPRKIAGNLMHESAHLAGAPSDPIAEFVLQTLDKASGLPR
jgi:hypothetical protein